MLSKIQNTVIDLLSTGLTQAEIANHLGLSEATISIIVRSSVQKLGADNLVSAILKFHEPNNTSEQQRHKKTSKPN